MRPIHGSHRLVLLTLSLLANVASGQQPRATLLWQDHGACSAPADADEQLASLLGPLAEGAVPLRVVANVERAGPGSYALTLRMQQGTLASERRLVLRSCDEVHETAVLLAAMTLEPRLEPQAPEPPQGARKPALWGVSAQIGVDTLSLPRVAAMGALGAALQLSRLRLSLQGRYAARSTGRLPSGAEAHLNLLAVAPGACLLWSAASVRWGLCAEAELGRLRGRASGVADAQSQQALWAAASAGGMLEYSPNRLVSLQLGATAGGAFRRPRFALRGEEPFHAVPVAVVRAMIGVTVWLPTTEL